MIGIVEYGCGNLRSLENALEALGMDCQRVSDPGRLTGCSRVILPGVGHFGHAMGRLDESGMASALRSYSGPLLGICLGMQLLFEGSEEAPGVSGLGLLPGRFLKFDNLASPQRRYVPRPVNADASMMRLKIPHMGWSALDFQGRQWAVYFVHSFCLKEAPEEAEIGWSTYGSPFVAAIRKGRLAGFQFHPERSGKVGLELLKEAQQW